MISENFDTMAPATQAEADGEAELLAKFNIALV
jgi:hypothetical protein